MTYRVHEELFHFVGGIFQHLGPCNFVFGGKVYTQKQGVAAMGLNLSPGAIKIGISGSVLGAGFGSIMSSLGFRAGIAGLGTECRADFLFCFREQLNSPMGMRWRRCLSTPLQKQPLKRALNLLDGTAL